MAFNSSNLVNHPSWISALPLDGTTYTWKYTTTDNLATVFSNDPITGYSYWDTDTKTRLGDYIDIVAADGNTLAFSQASQYSVHASTPHKIYPF